MKVRSITINFGAQVALSFGFASILWGGGDNVAFQRDKFIIF